MQQESFFHAMAGREGSLLQEFVFPRADGLTPHYLLVNLHRIIQDTTQIFHINKWKPSDLELSYIVEAIQQLNNHLGSIIEDDLLTKEVQANSSLTFRIHLCTTLAMHHVLKQFYLSREASDWVLGEIEAKFNQSLVNTGEMYSTLAAQLIGEPAMQMTLNTFHYAETQGLLGRNIQQELAYTSLHTVTAAVEIWYDLDPSSAIIEEDAVFVESFFAIPDEEMESKLHLQLP
ncbi:hypothetical protein AZE42_07470 [Rhizopogon vesiculosus]|uniref:Uncharacterized protein n=1 Tax=Rhizopogon vesiculosus TaxID=180088 RepID=A0A1J8PIG1_9AGAM|nr:hypothetical protein AZE42_07470 [Rhizopogon vesiculosus]